MHLAKGMIDAQLRDWQTSQESFIKAIEVSKNDELVCDEAKANFEFAQMLMAKNPIENKERANQRLSIAKDLFEKAGADKYGKLVSHYLMESLHA